MFLSLDVRARIVSSSWRKTNGLVLFCMVLPHVTWYDICLIMSWFTFVRQFNILLQINEQCQVKCIQIRDIYYWTFLALILSGNHFHIYDCMQRSEQSSFTHTHDFFYLDTYYTDVIFSQRIVVSINAIGIIGVQISPKQNTLVSAFATL